MTRIFLFLATNMAVIALATIVLKVLGIEDALARSGSGINLTGLLIFSAVFGMAGSFISL
ncbi:MAG: protease HtpX, partial [Pseudomonadota bacterium]